MIFNTFGFQHSVHRGRGSVSDGQLVKMNPGLNVNCIVIRNLDSYITLHYMACLISFYAEFWCQTVCIVSVVLTINVINSIVCFTDFCKVEGGHSPGKCGKVSEFKSDQGKKQKSGKCVLACGQLLRVLFLTQNMQETSSLPGKFLHMKHSCHSYERISEYCSGK